MLICSQHKNTTVPAGTPPVADGDEAAKAEPYDGSALTGDFTVRSVVARVGSASMFARIRIAPPLRFSLTVSIEWAPSLPNEQRTTTKQWRITDYAAPDGEVKRFSDTFTVGTYPW